MPYPRPLPPGLRWAFGLAVGWMTGCGLPGEGVEPGTCGDRIDNDGDYFFDCDDPGCAKSPECAFAQTDSGEAGGTTDDDTAGSAPSTCNDNTYTLTFEDGATLTLNAWIWQEGWGGAHLLGLATNREDGCTVAERFFRTFRGYDEHFFQIDIPSVPAAGQLVRIQEYGQADSADATARLENLSEGTLETSLDGGRMNVESVSLEGSFVARNAYTRMSGGTAPQGDFTACWCTATPIGPEPDD